MGTKLTYLYLLGPQIYDKLPAELTHHEIMLLQAQDSFLTPENINKNQNDKKNSYFIIFIVQNAKNLINVRCNSYLWAINFLSNLHWLIN